MEIKLLTGISVRTGPDNADGSVPVRRVGEEGDIITVADVPEWEGELPSWLVKHGKVEVVKDEPKAKHKAADHKAAEQKAEHKLAKKK